MTESTPDFPLETDTHIADDRATETFALLGNKTRLSILFALWEALEPPSDNDSVPFSELRDRVGVSDSGQFNYHLGKLAGRFIRKTDSGYELKTTGLRFVTTVISDAGIEDPNFEPNEVDTDCPACGGPVVVSYQDETLYRVCTECDAGIAGPFPRAGTFDRSPNKMAAAVATWSMKYLLPATQGVCGVCAGPIEASLEICDDHSSDGKCEICGFREPVRAFFICPVCKAFFQSSPRDLITFHPAVISFYHEHGVPLQYETADFESTERRRRLTRDHELELLSDDPPRVKIVIKYEGDELGLTMDESMAVIEESEFS